MNTNKTNIQMSFGEIKILPQVKKKKWIQRNRNKKRIKMAEVLSK